MTYAHALTHAAIRHALALAKRETTPVMFGVAWLDQFPVPWRHHIHADVLDVTNPRLTVLGQLFGHHQNALDCTRLQQPWRYGFDNPRWLDPEVKWAELQEDWIYALTEGRPSDG